MAADRTAKARSQRLDDLIAVERERSLTGRERAELSLLLGGSPVSNAEVRQERPMRVYAAAHSNYDNALCQINGGAHEYEY